MARILPVVKRIRLFKEINRIHKEMYGWKMLYWNPWSKVYFIDIDRDARATSNDWVPINMSEAIDFYFRDRRGMDICSLRGIFAWQAYEFYHFYPYNVLDPLHQLPDEDFISDSLGKRIRPDVGHPVKCLETIIDVQQRKEDGKIWISSNWLHHQDCYSAALPFGEGVYKAIDEAAGGDKDASDELKEKYERLSRLNRYYFEKALKGYYGGRQLKAKHWNGGYLFAASREWRIKTLEQLNSALDVEQNHFSNVLEEFIRWLKDGGLDLGEKGEEALRRNIRRLYEEYPWGYAKTLCKYLVEEDNAQPSDVYLWWGGEPNKDCCYAFLTLFFEIDPNEIGTSKFDEKISRNLRTIIDIAEKEHGLLSFYREYEPHIWKAVFS